MAQEIPNRSEFLTLPGAARLLGLDRRLLYQAARRQRFPVYVIEGSCWPRVRLAEVRRWIESQRVTPHATARVDEVLARQKRA